MLVTGEVYHIFNRSIAEFKIFNGSSDFSRIIEVFSYYQRKNPTISFSNFIKLKQGFLKEGFSKKDKIVQILAYCIMPTHLHLILKQLKEKGISTFMSNILNSYTRYFNIKTKRKGPLWEGRFQRVLVETDEQLLHLTRYIHLNPVTAYLVNSPEEWPASSYKEYVSGADNKDSKGRLCEYGDILEIEPNSYREFVEDNISYQRELAKIKNLLME